MEKILSIIIPSYNMEGYLRQCLDSLITEALPKLEIFVVNDGSKDNTLSIAKEYAEKYPESINVIDKKNGNYGSCINAALKAITGKYIKVLDADDSFDKANLDRFIDFLTETESDLVISDYVIVNEQGITTRECKFGDHEFKDRPLIDCISILYLPNFEMHAVTYKKEVFKGLNYIQSEGVSYTDMEWMFLPMTRVETVSFFNKTVYRYLIGREGQTVDLKVSIKAVDQTMTVMENLLGIYKKVDNQISELHKNYLQHRLARKVPSIYRICLIKTKGDTLYNRLKIFDDCLKNANIDLYHSSEKEDIKGFPFKYVKYWRKNYMNKGKMYSLNLISSIYNLLFK